MKTTVLLRHMMGFRPVSADVQAVNGLVDFLRAYLASKGLHTRTETLGCRRILYAATRPGRHSRVLMNAHLDVVPADEKTFGCKERGGWIVGRGAGDCLGNAAVLAQVLVRARGKADMAALFSTDEEIGGETTRHMVEKGYAGDFIVVADGDGYKVAVAQKGILTVRLTARGKACHGSTPWQGQNAIDRLIAGYLRVRKLFPPVRARDAWHNTLSANIIKGGTVFNRVPDAAELVLDIRCTEKTSQNDLLGRIRRVSGLRAEAIGRTPTVFCDETAPRMAVFVRFMAKRLGRRVATIRLNGATDARHFQALHVPLAIIGVPSRDPHGAQDAVSRKGLGEYEDMLAAYGAAHAPCPPRDRATRR